MNCIKHDKWQCLGLINEGVRKNVIPWIIQHVWSRFQTDDWNSCGIGLYSRKYFNTTSVTTITLNVCSMCLLCHFAPWHTANDVSISMSDTESDAVTSETPWQCASLQHDLINCFNWSIQWCQICCHGILAPAAWPPNGVIRVVGAPVRLDEGDILTPQVG